MRYSIFVILIINFCIGGFSQSDVSYRPTKQTPEPGTKLSCMSFQMVKRINKVIATSNPDSVFSYYKKKIPKCLWKSGHYTDTVIGDNAIPIRLFYPNKRTQKHASNSHLPVLVFYHGGGFIWGSLDMFHSLAQTLSKKLNCMVVLPDYRLAPEHPYPTPVNDCYMVLNWVFNNISNFGGNAKKVGLIGDSAGANLALVSGLNSQNHKSHPPICFQVLYYPSTTMVDTALASRSYFGGEKGAWYVLNKPLLEEIKEDYLRNTPDTLWQVSPLYAQYNASNPPTLIITAQCDPLRDEGQALAQKMKQSGVNVTHICYPKTIHGFVSFYPFLKQARKAIRVTKQFAKQHFNA